MQYTLCMYANISIYMYIYIYCKVFVKTGFPKTIGFQQSTCPVLDDSGTPIKKNTHGSSINLSRVFCMDRGSGTAVRYSLVNEYRLI